MMGVAMAEKDVEFAVMLVVQYVAQRIVQSDGRPGHSSFKSRARAVGLLLAPQEELKTSKTGEFDESVLLDGRLSVAFGKVLIHSWQGGNDSPLEPISGKVRRGFCQMGRDLGSKRDHDSCPLGSSRRSVVRCAWAIPIVDGNSKARQMAQREECQKVRETRSVAQGNLETVDSHAKIWATGDKPHAAAARRRNSLLLRPC